MSLAQKLARRETNAFRVERENTTKLSRSIWDPRQIRSLWWGVVRQQRTVGIRLGCRAPRISSWRLSAPSERQSNKRTREEHEQHVPFCLLLDYSEGGRLKHQEYVSEGARNRPGREVRRCHCDTLG